MIDPIAAANLESTPRIDISGGMTAGQRQNNGSDRRRAAATVATGDTVTLSPEAQQQLAELRQRDREVRSHEQAHIAAGGSHVSGGASFTYQRGPDGRSYAVGGSVSIDTSPVPGDPDATLEKARQIRNAAMAPGNPSAQDQSVASQAGRLEMQARAEKNSGAGEENGEGPTGAASSSSVLLFKPAVLKARGDKAAAVYQAIQDSAQPPTDLAPWGTGIAYVV